MRLTVLLTTIPSDAHSWNLIYMEKFVQELGFAVTNLGVCVPYDLTVKIAQSLRPNLLLVSTVNGHGYIEGAELAERIRGFNELKDLTMVIGGKINTDIGDIEEHEALLLSAGYDAVFSGKSTIQDFDKMARLLASPVGIRDWA